LPNVNKRISHTDRQTDRWTETERQLPQYVARCQEQLATGDWQLKLQLANEYIYTFYLLVYHEAGEDYISFVEYRIGKFMIDRLVH